MTVEEHFQKAEWLLSVSTADNPVTVAEAQVHATLALALFAAGKKTIDDE